MKTPITKPFLRPLKVFAIDPTFSEPWNKTSIDVINDGPERFIINDVDGSTGFQYESLALNDPAVMIGGGLDQSEGDPRFHQQMVHAVCSRTLDLFDRALGRPVPTHGFLPSGERAGIDQDPSCWGLLTIMPHAFYGANAYFKPSTNEIRFGYFTADSEQPGRNLPGQMVFACLSYDVIAHELTHAILHQLKPLYALNTNPQVLGFHEGFADIVALFQHFIDPGIVRSHLLESGAHLDRSALVEIARQMGHGMGMQRSLRSAIADETMRLSEDQTDPHQLGSILVAAVFDAYVSVHLSSVTRLARLVGASARKGTDGFSEELSYELASQLATEASNTARTILNMCIRAIDYMPPIDPNFGDFLRALITVDGDLHPVDRFGFRSTFIESFRKRGIFPLNAMSMREDSVRLPSADATRLGFAIDGFIEELNWLATRTPLRAGDRALGGAVPANRSNFMCRGERFGRWMSPALAADLEKRASAALGLEQGSTIVAVSFDPTFRVSTAGRVLPEIVAQFIVSSPQGQRGLTFIADLDGSVRYLIEKANFTVGARAASYEDWRLRSWGDVAEELHAQDPASHVDFCSLHGGCGG